MAGLTQSYANGASTAPLLGETIGANFDDTARRHGDCDALVVRQQNIRWTYGELKERVDRSRSACSRSDFH